MVGDAAVRRERRRRADELIEKVADDLGRDEFAEVCADVEHAVRDETQHEGYDRHAAIAACYMVADRLAERGRQNGDSHA